MEELQVFDSAEFGAVRTATIDGEPMFCLADACRVLGIGNPSQARTRLNGGGVITNEGVDSKGRSNTLTFISESNLYKLIFQSRKPEAERFADWVTSEVLPTIRKHGAYMTSETLKNAIHDPDFLLQLVTELKNEKDRNKTLQMRNSELAVQATVMKPKAEYFDELVDRNLLSNFTEVAKELGVKRKDFIGFLLEQGYIYRDKKGNLMPRANEKAKSLFEVKQCSNQKTTWAGCQTLLTPKGVGTFRLLCQGI